MLGARVGARYFLYPFAAAVFAVVGFLTILRTPERPAARRLMWFGLGYLAALTGLYCFYLFTDPVFILPAAFVLFIAAGSGAATANRWMRDVFANRNRSAGQFARAAGVILLDALLIISLGSEVAIRLSARPAESVMVPTLRSADSTLPPNAIVVSNISLQFLELYLPAENRRFVGLNSLDPRRDVHRLPSASPLRKKSRRMERLNPASSLRWSYDVSRSRLASCHKNASLLLLAAPESQQYADVLKTELEQLQSKFVVDPVAQNRDAQLYRLTTKPK